MRQREVLVFLRCCLLYCDYSTHAWKAKGYLQILRFQQHAVPGALGRAVSIRKLLPFLLAVPTVLADSVLLLVQAVFLTLQLPGWLPAQAVCLALLLLNGKPLLQAVKKLLGARCTLKKDRPYPPSLIPFSKGKQRLEMQYQRYY